MNGSWVARSLALAASTLLLAATVAAQVVLAPPAAAATAKVSIGDTAVVEGNSGTQTATLAVELSGPVATNTVISYQTVDGSAVAAAKHVPGDYKAVAKNLTIKAGKTAGKVSVPIYGDTDVEGDEQFTVVLTGTNNGVVIARGTGTVTIVDDESPPYSGSTVAIGDSTVPEGNTGTVKASLDVTVSQPLASNLHITYQTVDGTATASAKHIPGDYKPAAKTLTIKAGKTKGTINIVVDSDTTPEPTEIFTVELTGTDNGAVSIARSPGTVTILDDDNFVPTVPSPPLDVTATLSQPSDCTTLCGDIDISWSPPDDDGGSAITGYLLAVSKNGGAYGVVEEPTGTSFTGYSCGTPAQACQFEVYAVNGVGNSDASDPSTVVTTQGNPSPPLDVTATLAQPTGCTNECGLVNVSWSPELDDGGSALYNYAVYVSTNGSAYGHIATTTGTGTQFNCGLTDVSCQFEVVVDTYVGESDYSAPSNAVVTQGNPSPPLDVTATLAQGEDCTTECGLVNVSWSPELDDGGSALYNYAVYVSTNGSAYGVIATTTGTGSQFNCGVPSVSCQFEVVVDTYVGASDYSAPSNVVVTQDHS